jgi:hypothetical protein
VGSANEVTEIFSFDAPSPTGGGQGNAAYTGGQILSIVGDGFGPGGQGSRHEFSIKASVGHSNCMSTQWLSESSLLCKVPAGSYCAVGPIVVTAFRGHARFSRTQVPTARSPGGQPGAREQENSQKTISPEIPKVQSGKTELRGTMGNPSSPT